MRTPHRASIARTLRWSSITSYQDFRAVYGLPAWIAGWVLRCLCQVGVFGLLGRYVGGDDLAWFLTVGTAILVGLGSVSLVVQSAAWERRTGSLPLVLASPASPCAVLAGRGVVWLVDAVAVSVISLLVVPRVLGLHMPVARVVAVVPVLLVMYVGMYSFCLAAAALTLDSPGARNLVSNVATAVVGILSGIQVPLAFWPAWIRGVAEALPVTRGVPVVRDVLSGAAVDAQSSIAQVTVSCVWLITAIAALTYFVRHARRSGRIEFGD